MNNYIFLTHEGYTFQPNSEETLPDIENLQVVGFAKGINSEGAFKNLIDSNAYLIETTFDEIFCYELKNNYLETRKEFYISCIKS